MTQTRIEPLYSLKNIQLTYLIVSCSVEGDEGGGPEGVHTVGAQDHVRVVQLVVVRDPASNESPEGLHAWVGAEASDLLGLATCIQ